MRSDRGPSLAELSAMPLDAFVAVLDGIYEHSPWVAEAAWWARPFATLPALASALTEAVAAAPAERRLALVRAHPELAGRVAPGGMAPLSAGEQGRAGLDRCSAAELAQLRALNAAYAERFGFPFVVAVRGLTPSGIIAAMQQRLQHGRAEELAEALRQVERIAWLRLQDRLGGGGAAHLPPPPASPTSPRMSSDIPMSEAPDRAGLEDAAPPETADELMRAATARIAALEAERDDYKDRWMRAEAEAQNARSRARRDIDDARQFAVQKFASDVAEAADNLKRGLDSIPAAQPDEPELAGRLRDGFAGVERSFLALLERNGIVRTDPTGAVFDPNLHQAMSEQESAEHPPGTVVQAWTPAWTLHGRLLRPAMVVVSRAPAAAPAPPGGALDTPA